MGIIIPIHRHRVFSREDAEALLPIIRRITQIAANAALELRDQLKFIPEDEPLASRLRSEHDLIIKRWAIKITRLGCEPKGAWIVDFLATEGWFTWRLGDENLNFFHSQTLSTETVLGNEPFPLFSS